MTLALITNPNALKDCLKRYREDEDFRVKPISKSYYDMRGIRICWSNPDRALYFNHIINIMKAGKFKALMVRITKKGDTEVWFYNIVDEQK